MQLRPGAPEIGRHLLAVAATLRSETSPDLPPEARTRRIQHLARLERYARDGRVPQHRDAVPVRARRVVPPRRFEGRDPNTPLFVDDAGVHCAVGHLMAHDDPALVARIRADDNGAYLLEMDAHRPDIERWAAAAGFTLDELGWVQPGYHPCPPPPECVGEALAPVDLEPADVVEDERASVDVAIDDPVVLVDACVHSADDHEWVSLQLVSVGVAVPDQVWVRLTPDSDRRVTFLAPWREDGVVGPFDLGPRATLPANVEVEVLVDGEVDRIRNAGVADPPVFRNEGDSCPGGDGSAQGPGCATAGARSAGWFALVSALVIGRRRRSAGQAQPSTP